MQLTSVQIGDLEEEIKSVLLSNDMTETSVKIEDVEKDIKRVENEIKSMEISFRDSLRESKSSILSRIVYEMAVRRTMRRTRF